MRAREKGVCVKYCVCVFKDPSSWERDDCLECKDVDALLPGVSHAPNASCGVLEASGTAELT